MRHERERVSCQVVADYSEGPGILGRWEIEKE